jgi:hypothetical protein
MALDAVLYQQRADLFFKLHRRWILRQADPRSRH